MSPQTDLASAKVAVAAFRDALIRELHPLAPRSLAPHVAWYKPANSAFGAHAIRGPLQTGLLTTADFVWSGKARFWISVGRTPEGIVGVVASMNGFGIMEGVLGEALAPNGDVAAAGTTLGRKAAGTIKAERSGFGDW